MTNLSLMKASLTDKPKSMIDEIHEDAVEALCYRGGNNGLSESTKATYRSILRDFNKFLKQEALYIDEHTIRLYFEELKTRHRPATLNTKKYALMKIFKAIFAEDHVMKNVLVEKAIEKTFQQIPSYKTDKVVDDVLSEETVKDIIDAAPTQKTKLIIRFLFKTGCRVSEMVNIRLSDCESKRKYVRLRIIGKGNKERKLYIPKDLFSEIQQEFRGKSYLFESETGRQLHRRNVLKQVRRAGLRAGFNITSHDLRHARATDLLLRKNVSLKAVSRYLGHSTTATTADMYIHDEFSVSEIFSQDSF